MNTYSNDISLNPGFDQVINAITIITQESELKLAKQPDTNDTTICTSEKTLQCFKDMMEVQFDFLNITLQSIVKEALLEVFVEISQKNLGPTRGSRLMYLWFVGLVGGWNFGNKNSIYNKVIDRWDWTEHQVQNDTINWMKKVIEIIQPYFINKPKLEVKGRFHEKWDTWWNYRQKDGYVDAQKIPNYPNGDNVILADSCDIDPNHFPHPNKWTPLQINGVKRNYLTYNWRDVLSTCISEQDQNEMDAYATHKFPTETQRKEEIENVINFKFPDEQQIELGDRNKIIAEFWEGGLGTVSPPLMNIWLWFHFMKSIQISNDIFMKSGLEIAINMFEIGREIWGVKKLFMQSRPIQDVRRFFANENVKSPFGGFILGKCWLPYQKSNFITPPFADIPSGHSAFTKGFSLVMTKYFGEKIPKNEVEYEFTKLFCPILKSQKNQFGSFKIEKNTSQIQSQVPNSNVDLDFNKWEEFAQSAGFSRFYGGIHAYSAHIVSNDLAKIIHSKINQVWK